MSINDDLEVLSDLLVKTTVNLHGAIKQLDEAEKRIGKLEGIADFLLGCCDSEQVITKIEPEGIETGNQGSGKV